MLDPLPRELYRAAQVREFDHRTIHDHGVPGIALMERAAVAAWQALRTRWPLARRIVVLCGSGNNAGDGYLVALLARRDGSEVLARACFALAFAHPEASAPALEALARDHGYDVPLELPFAGATSSIQPGETWLYQLWYRESLNGAGDTSNFSNAIEVVYP